MDWQQAASLCIVALAAAMLWRGRYRRRKTGVSALCGCGSGAAGRSQSSIVYHARKGERRQVIVRFG